jgi:hypothetical protein
MSTQHVRIVNGAVSQFTDVETGEIKKILRGEIDTSTLRHLLTDDYQREALPLSQLKSILSAYEKREMVPDIELGMRGMRVREKDGAFFLLDPTFIVDGLQRVSGAKFHLMNKPEIPLHIGAAIRLNTTKEWERDRFRILNSKRLKVASNILLRNMRENSRMIATLITLSKNDKSFALCNKVNWEQHKKRGDYISAMTLCRIVGTLHSHKSPGRSANVDDVVRQLDKAADVVGVNTMRENIRLFFETVDECWGIRHIKYSERAPQIRHTFLIVLAKLLSDGKDFWQGSEEKKLYVTQPLRDKMRKFKLLEPYIEHLCGSGGKAGDELYKKFREHLDKGKRTRRLRFRNGDVQAIKVPEHDEEYVGSDHPEGEAAVVGAE